MSSPNPWGFKLAHVFGKTIDNQTRCVHYGTAKDIIAIKFKCCLRYYPCHLCHEQLETHVAEQWAMNERQQKAVLCGVCSTEHTIHSYLSANSCPSCHAPFNERCRLHAHLYFATHEANYGHVDIE
ncbi:MAG: CHY zinc finger protein [Candidatus Dormibacteraceae bacterium]